MVAAGGELRRKQGEAGAKAERLRAVAGSRQDEADAMAEWQGLATDAAHREAFYFRMGERQECLDRVRARNSRLEVYLKELEGEE